MSLETEIAELRITLNDLNVNLAAMMNARNSVGAADPSPAVVAAMGESTDASVTDIAPPKPTRGRKPASTPTAASSPTTAEPAKPASDAPAGSVVNSEKAAPQLAATETPADMSTSLPSQSKSTEAESGVTLAMLTTAFKKVAQTKGRDAVVNALAAVGATNLGEVTPDQYPTLLSELDTALLM